MIMNLTSVLWGNNILMTDDSSNESEESLFVPKDETTRIQRMMNSWTTIQTKIFSMNRTLLQRSYLNYFYKLGNYSIIW